LKKLLLRLLIVVLFSVSVFLTIQSSPQPKVLASSLFLFLNFIIILAALYFGAEGIITFGLLSILAVFIYSLRISEILIFPILLLILTQALLYAYFLRFDRTNQKIVEELDQLDEQKNILAVELNHSRGEVDALKQKLQRFSALKWLTEVLSSTLSWERTNFLITTETLKIVGKTSACLLYLVDKQSQGLKLVGTKLNVQNEMKQKKGDLFDSWVFKQRLPLLVTDTKKDFRFHVLDPEGDTRGVRSLISAPLVSKNRLRGVLRLDNASPDAYDIDDLRLLGIIADLAAVAVENTLLYQRMQNLAITDGLTGLFVHRYFQQRFGEEISRALWTNSQMALLMLDIDNFKNYNDTYGHIAGDVILKQISKLIVSSVNPGDVVARYGGEEFAVLLLDTGADQARKIAEQIREKVERKKFALRRKVSEVRISGGVAFFPGHGRVKENLIQKADQALYRAKREGKNRICIY